MVASQETRVKGIRAECSDLPLLRFQKAREKIARDTLGIEALRSELAMIVAHCLW
jgi:hypothetical protein